MATLQKPTVVPADFFPVEPGTVRLYEDKTGGALSNSIGQPLDSGGVATIPITESIGGRDGRTTYYRIDPDQVCVVAYDPKNPLPTPLPIIKIGTGKLTWDYQGKTASGANGERLLAHGESHLAGQKNILGKKVDILIVKLEAAIGVGISGYTFEQTTVYGKGLGLVEQKTKVKLGKKTTESSYKLVSITAAK